jgi:phosphatidylinositol alpha-mannosyltransferase
VTVLPALREPFGMVVLESLASGTPVVGARSGALPEILTDAAIGTLFEPGIDLDRPTNLDGLVQALDQGLALGARSETSERCRRAAEPFGWERLGPEFERLYERLVGVPRDGLERRQAS